MRQLALLTSILVMGCDERSQPPVTDRAPVAEQAEQTEPPASEPAEEIQPPPADPPKPVGGPHCDQRDLADASGEPKRMCVDFGEHTGVTEIRCHEGTTLAEGGCPSEGLIASCKLPSTGVTLQYYAGKPLDDARRDCDAIDGSFSQP